MTSLSSASEASCSASRSRVVAVVVAVSFFMQMLDGTIVVTSQGIAQATDRRGLRLLSCNFFDGTTRGIGEHLEEDTAIFLLLMHTS
jgi:hypothetical protein